MDRLSFTLNGGPFHSGASRVEPTDAASETQSPRRHRDVTHDASTTPIHRTSGSTDCAQIPRISLVHHFTTQLCTSAAENVAVTKSVNGAELTLGKIAVFTSAS